MTVPCRKRPVATSRQGPIRSCKDVAVATGAALVPATVGPASLTATIEIDCSKHSMKVTGRHLQHLKKRFNWNLKLLSQEVQELTFDLKTGEGLCYTTEECEFSDLRLVLDSLRDHEIQDEESKNGLMLRRISPLESMLTLVGSGFASGPVPEVVEGNYRAGSAAICEFKPNTMRALLGLILVFCLKGTAPSAPVDGKWTFPK